MQPHTHSEIKRLQLYSLFKFFLSDFKQLMYQSGYKQTTHINTQFKTIINVCKIVARIQVDIFKPSSDLSDNISAELALTLY
jgi:hypothetical protein